MSCPSIDDPPVQPSAATIPSPSSTSPTVPSPRPTPPSVPLNAILGGVLGGAALVLLSVIFFMWRRQHRLRIAKLDMVQSTRTPGGNAHEQAPPGASRPEAASHGGGQNAPAPYGGAYGTYGAPSPNDDSAAPPGPIVRGVAPGKVIADVRRPLVSGDGQYARASTYMTPWPNVVAPSEVDNASEAGRSTVLAQQVENLQAEVEILRAAYVHHRQGAPPAYG
jgi:predicted lipid-binding transport protein (Tim44 family)